MAGRRVAKTLSLAVLTVVLTLGVWTSVSAAEVFPATPLTYNDYDDYSGGVSGDRVVWMGWDGSDFELYTRTMSGNKLVKITGGSYEGFEASVSGDRVVWCRDNFSGYSDIYTWTPGASAGISSTYSYDDFGPRVSGDRVVWTGYDGSDYEVYTWTPTGGKVQLTDNSDDDCAFGVSGDRIVWSSDGGGDYEVYTWTPSSGPVQLTNNSDYDNLPDVSGDRVVWEGDNEDERAIYTWTPSGGTVKVTSGELDVYPQVSGDRIVWERWDQASDNLDSEICTWTPSGGTVQLTSNDYEDVYVDVSGDRIAWTREVYDYTTAGLSPSAEKLRPLDAEDAKLTTRGERPNSALQASGVVRPAGPSVPLRSSVHTWTPAEGAVQVADYATGASVDGDRLIWDSFDPNEVQDTELSTAIAHTRFDDKSAKVTYAPGWPRWDNSNYWAAYQDTYAYTDKIGDKVIVTFKGTSLSWVACTSNTKGMASVSLYDGTDHRIAATFVDLYSASTKWKQWVFSTGMLPDDTYTMVIECLGWKNSSATWRTIDVDAFDIRGTLEQSLAVTQVDDKVTDSTADAYFTYTPGIATGASTSQWSRWDNSNYWAAYQDTYAYTDQVGFKTTFTFDGISAAWVACTSNTKGKAKVTVDGKTAEARTVDLYSPTTLWKQKVYDTGVLAPGPHTVEIECLGTKNAKSWYHTIDVDRFDILATAP